MRPAIVALVLLGCGSSPPATDANMLAPEDFSYHALTLGSFDGDGRVGPLGFGGPLSTASGDQTYFVGEIDNRYTLLSLRGPDAPVFAKGLVPSMSARVSSIVPDGAGGVYVAINLPDAVSSNPMPALTRWDRSGNLLWSKRYDRSGTFWAGLTNRTGFSPDVVHPDVMLAPAVNGKVVMLVGNSVVAVDETGAPVWTYYIAASYGFQQVVANATSVRVFGRNYRDMVELTFDWAGTLQSFRRSTDAFPPNSDARLFRPHVRPDGTLWFTYEILMFTNATTGGFALATDGTRVDGWRYNLHAERQLATLDLQRAFILSDTLLDLEATVKTATGTTPVHLAMPTSATGALDITRYSVGREPWVLASDGSVQSFENLQVGAGTAGAQCSRGSIEVFTAERVADTTLFPSFVAMTPPTATPFTTTPLDFPITIVDMPPTSMLSTHMMTAGCR